MRKGIKQIKKVICIMLAIGLIMSSNIPVYATQNRMNNYSRSFSLCGNGADDIVSVAMAQIGKTGSQLGYSEEWCADFVSDCAELANQGTVIPRNGYCPSLQNAILNAGGYQVAVSSAQKGDIAFYGTNGASHVEIIYANSNGRISSIGGNSGSASNCYSRSVRNHTYQTMTITKVLRPNYRRSSQVLPGTVDTSWNVPVNVVASHRITTYDQWGNAESNHYIDPGDNCYVAEVYTNGFVKVQYPVSGGKRWTYAKASDFSLSKKQENKLPDTRLTTWFSLSPMGAGTASVRFNDRVYLCYRLETMDGKLLDGSIGNYEVKETIYRPDGSSGSLSYRNNNNWISECFSMGGTYRGVIQISGDYTGSVETSIYIPQPYKVLLSTWFSETPMGSKITSMEKGKEYYCCFSLVANEKGYYNQSINTEYTALQELYSPDGIKIETWSKSKTDHNYIKFKATQSGNYKSVATLTGMPPGTMTEMCVCKDTTKLESISVSKNPAKTTYVVGESFSTSGMIVTAKYSDGKTKNVTSYKVMNGNTSKIGKQRVDVSYSEGGITKEISFYIQVNEATHTFGSWSITKKTTCVENGIEQRTCSYCGKVETRTIKATGHTYKDTVYYPTSTQKGYTLHTCTKCGYSYKDNYTNVKKQLQSITITTKPDKLEYYLNESLDTAGIKVVANYSDGSKNEVKYWRVSGTTASVGKQTITISYSDNGITKTASYDIQVKENNVKKEFCTIVYETNGGSMSRTTQTGEKGKAVQISSEKPIKNITVKFNSNGAGSTPSSLTLQQTFIRWICESASGSVSYYPSNLLQLTQNYILEAEYGNVYLNQLPEMKRKGYSFDGWYTENNERAYIGMEIRSNLMLTAKWTKLSLSDDEDWDDSDLDQTDDENETLVVGDEITTDTAIYTITKMNGTPTLELTEWYDDDSKTAVIRDCIVIDGVVYTITSIGAKAFYKNDTLEDLFIGYSIKKIDKKALYGCKSLKSIVIDTLHLKSGNIGADAFKKVNKNVRVYVPKSKYKTYKKLLKRAGIGSKAAIYKLRTKD